MLSKPFFSKVTKKNWAVPEKQVKSKPNAWGKYLYFPDNRPGSGKW